MKILHIATHLNTGGITTYLRALVSEQSKAGHDVFLRASPGVCQDDFSEITKDIVTDIPRCKSEVSPRLWVQLPGFIAYLKKHRIDIVHTHTRVAQVLAAAAKKMTGIPYVSTAHMFYKNRLGRRLFPCWGSAVIANSETMKNGLLTIFDKKRLPPITVAVNGIDVEGLRSKMEKLDRMKCRKEFGCQDHEIIVLSLARLIPVKGAHVLIESFALALKQCPTLRLLIAGIGEPHYEKTLKDRVKELGVSDRVTFLGNVIKPEKAFKAADIFAAPYLWPEAFGLSILEAMAAGLPVIGSRSGGIGELLGNGRSGLLFNEKNVEELSDCLLAYANDAALRSRMAAAGGAASLNYTSRIMYEKIQKVYNDVAGIQ